MVAFFALALPLLASSPHAPSYGISAIEMRDGYPVFTVGGKPFFIWGASFFYERIPRDEWRSSLQALKRLHVNTLDLYIPWNWHEISDGDFDFTGRTDARRDLRGLLRLARAMGFYLVIRPGPVIRNEWRNGGYPAWLLKRREYGMPLHDVLEGRYPATATLQNERSDDAAAQWLRNRVHLRYAQRWLQHALVELRPVADRVLAIQLDDDQGAYLTNQTWPAPHLQAYLLRLRSIVQRATSPRVPVYINTYNMQVTASSPVWAMGNWYQSDAKTFGPHDQAQLLFSTGLLGTRPDQPIVLSEFQAGWLLAPESIYPRASDPSNTFVALQTAFAAGARGIIDFPMQDTLAPPGWEAPFANRFYAWDAALRVDGRPAARYAPSLEFGRLVAREGALLAATHPVVDAAIVWWPSAVKPAPLSGSAVLALADATIAAQRECRAHELTCALVDLRYASSAELRRYSALIEPPLPHGLVPTAFARRRLDVFARRHALLASLREADARGLIRRRVVRGLPGATLHVGRDEHGHTVAFLDAVNAGSKPIDARVSIRYPGVHADLRVRLRPHAAFLDRIDALESGVAVEPHVKPSSFVGVPIRRDVEAPVRDVGSIVLENARTRVILSRRAGGRAFVFENLAHQTSAFTTVGALRDDVSIQPPPSKTDRIAAYTHTFPAGTFNRPYRAQRLSATSVRLSYDAPDVVPHGARFEKIATLEGDALQVRERLVPFTGAERQRLVVRSSLAIGETNASRWQPPILLPARTPLRYGSSIPLATRVPLALYDAQTGELVVIRWSSGALESAHLDVEDRHAVFRAQYRPGWNTTWYAYTYVRDLRDALARLRAAASGSPL